MPAALSEILDIILEGSTEQLRALLTQKGAKWPKDPVMHPVWDLLEIASNARLQAPDLAGKLAVLLDFGTPVDFTLEHRAKISRNRWRTAAIGLPSRYGGREDNILLGYSSLLARAAGIGRIDLVDLLMERGAKFYSSGLGNHELPFPLKLAAENGQMDMLLHLVDPNNPTSKADWASWAKAAFKRLPNDRPDVLDLIIATSPDPEDPKGRKAIIRALSEKTPSKANIQWLERDPSLWGKLHKEPLFDGVDTTKPVSLWPIVLKDALNRGVETPLFKQALEHTIQTGQINQPVMQGFLMMWGQEKPLPGRIPLLGWNGHCVPLPPLQALLHEVAEVSNKTQYRRVRRIANQLIRAGANIWAGNGANEAPVTEAMLWEEDRVRPSARWLAKFPDLILPHPKTGQTPLGVAMSAKGAQHWVDCGVSLTTVDHEGNQEMAKIVSRTGGAQRSSPRHYASNATDWAKWVEDGWANGTLPLDGTAYGRTIDELACSRNALAAGWVKRAKRAPGKDGFALHVAAEHLNATTVEQLLNAGYDPGVLDGAGWSPLAHLAASTQRSWDGHEDNSFKRIVTLLQAKPWPDNIAGQKVDPWQIVLSHDSALKFLSRDADPSLAKFFWGLHAARTQDESRWTPQDSTMLLRHYTQEDQGRDFQTLIATLPQKMLDDMALALFDPQRWPEGYENGLLQGPDMLRRLLSRGADLNGVSIEGKRLSDTWAALQAHEDKLRDDGEERLRAAISLIDMPESKIAIAAIQAQELEETAPNGSTGTAPRRRL